MEAKLERIRKQANSKLANQKLVKLKYESFGLDGRTNFFFFSFFFLNGIVWSNFDRYRRGKSILYFS